MKPIKFGEIRINENSKNHILNCIESNNTTMGVKVKQFEYELGDLLEAEYCTLMSSGTTALAAAFMTLWETDGRPGHIIFPAISFIASYTAARMAGFDIKLVDVNYDMCINESLVEEAITKGTRAICAVNLMGHMCNLVQLRRLATKHGIPLIVDNCECYGGKDKHNRQSSYYADMEITSHYTAHILPIGGEGGCVLTNNHKLDRLLKMIRNHGREPDTLYFDHKIFSSNFKNTDIHAAIGLGQISEFKDNFDTRMDHLETLLKWCEPYSKFAIFNQSTTVAPHAFTIILKPDYQHKMQDLQYILNTYKIEYKRNFGWAGSHGCMKQYNFNVKDYPIANFVGQGIHIGVHEYLIYVDLLRIKKALNNFFGSLE